MGSQIQNVQQGGTSLGRFILHSLFIVGHTAG